MSQTVHRTDWNVISKKLELNMKEVKQIEEKTLVASFENDEFLQKIKPIVKNLTRAKILFWQNGFPQSQ